MTRPTSQAVKISNSEMLHVREAAVVYHRSVAGQAEHWIRLGRAIERHPGFSHAKIEQALRGLLSPDDLDGDEQEEFFDQMENLTLKASPAEEAFWEQRRAQGLGVGMTDDGALEFARKRKSRK